MPPDRRRTLASRDVGPLVIVAAFVLVFGTLALARHYCLCSWTFDLGIKAQVLFNGVHGRLLESSVETPHYFGDHFNPTMLLLLPLYAIAPTPVTLIVVQCLFFALGGWVVGRLAWIHIPERPALPTLAAGVYLFQASAGNIVLYDFHETPLIAMLMLLAALAVETRRPWWAAVALVLGLGCKEDAGLAVAAFWTWLMLRHRRRRVGIALMAGGVVYSFLCLAVIIPAFRGGPSDTAAFFAPLGETPAQAVLTTLTRPWVFLYALVNPPVKLLYLAWLLTPTLFLPLRRPAWLLPACWVVLPLLLSMRASHYSGRWHYDAAILPFLALALLETWRQLARRKPRFPGRWFAAATIAALLVSNVNTQMFDWAGRVLSNCGRTGAFATLAARIPADAPLAASLNLGPHLIRRQLQVYPVLDWPPATFPDLPEPQAEFAFVDYAFEAEHRGLKREPQHRRLIESGYEIVGETSDFTLYRRRGDVAGEWQPDPLAPTGNIEIRIGALEEFLRGEN